MASPNFLEKQTHFGMLLQNSWKGKFILEWLLQTFWKGKFILKWLLHIFWKGEFILKWLLHIFWKGKFFLKWLLHPLPGSWEPGSYWEARVCWQ
jgi:hypothetical protein